MKKRILALTLCLCTLLTLAPLTANATVLPGMTSKVDYDNTDPNLYQIEVDLVNQVITVYQGANIVLQNLCTTGNSENPTGSGVFKLGDLKERFGYFVAYGQYAQYWTQVVRGVYIHSVMYDKKNTTSMSKSAYRNLGKNVSHGCIRVLPEVAQWIYYNCPPGTVCRIVKNKTRNTALTSALKAAMPAYGDYVQPSDARPAPAEVPAAVRYDNVPLRTGFSASRDKTVATLGANAKVMLLQIGAEWCKVRTQSGTLGYVKSAYLLCYPDQPVQSHEAYAATKKTYLYESMDTGSDRLATLASGAEVEVTANPKKGWYNANFNGASGYVRTKYVKLSTTVVYPEVTTQALIDAANSATTTDSQGATVTTGARTKSNIRATLRSGPASSFPAVNVLDPGTPVEVASVEGTWYYVAAAGTYGYVHSSCLTY